MALSNDFNKHYRLLWTSKEQHLHFYMYANFLSLLVFNWQMRSIWIVYPGFTVVKNTWLSFYTRFLFLYSGLSDAGNVVIDLVGNFL